MPAVAMRDLVAEIEGHRILDGLDLAVEEGDGDGGKCPTGWSLVANHQTKKKGQSVDANGDGMICLKNLPGGGNGNTDDTQNVKDNNGP